MELNEMKKELFYEPKHAMETVDEAVIEAPADTSLKDICRVMGQTPSWANGLILRADGYICDFYKKD